VLGLLAAHAGRGARVGAHGDPVGGAAIEAGDHALGGVGGVGQVGRGEAGAHAILGAVVPHVREVVGGVGAGRGLVEQEAGQRGADEQAAADREAAARRPGHPRERVQELAQGRRSTRGLGVQAAAQQRLDAGRHATAARDRQDLAGGRGEAQLGQALAGERSAAVQRLVGGDAEREDVGGGGHVAARELLRCHVRGRAHDRAGQGEGARAGR
jgi:hypothetical protein